MPTDKKLDSALRIYSGLKQEIEEAERRIGHLNQAIVQARAVLVRLERTTDLSKHS